MGDAVVVGAGIGGLTAAVALAQRGWSVTVLEQSRSLEPVGAGIALAPNAIRALDAVGLADEVRSMAALQGDAGLRRPDGRWLVRASVDAAGDRLGERTVILHRAQLVELLRRALPDGALRLGVRVTGVVPGDRDTRAHVATAPAGSAVEPSARQTAPAGSAAGEPSARQTGPAAGEPSARQTAPAASAAGEPSARGTAPTGLDADLVVAADGIDSPTRAALFPGHPGPTYTGVTAWRFVTDGPVVVEAAETWGRGSIVGLTPLADGRVYGYLTAALPEGTRFDDDAAELRARFADWHDPIPALLADLEPGRVLHHDLRWLATPLPRFDVGRVALLGDAAHAMPPNLGQGGCQALEDGVTLAALLARGPDVRTALAAYSVVRVPRTTRVARASARVGAPTAWTGRTVVALREAGMRLTGPFAARLAMRQLEPILSWRPPA
ncbi:FAD-dependent oxidoreductase [Cellulomonas alba]|uniref:FAD-dependent oxidoreductase n=1 Tax=Cellulomonas alba TaxID=3053467 RepID=A0ABT7SG52_9CELL|nr:FAD-dependent oxidoreductase [Cellulomonas alba]MDM7855155.1 FAD-dependent oxidoreductase [Cellulomonas alba]